MTETWFARRDDMTSTDGEKLIAPTQDEVRNGWTAETLTDFLRRSTAHHERLRLHPDTRGSSKMQLVRDYDALRW